MSLTGVPLILLAVLATAATITATALLWSRYGRWRLLSRAAGILLTETLAVLALGLAVNRHEQLYPSWQALAGDTGTTAVTAAQQAGRLDGELHGTAAAAVPWRPDGATAWRLAATPSVVVPARYLSRPAVSYPAVVALVDPGPGAAGAVKAAKRLAAVSVVAVPSGATTGAALAALPADLSQDVRVTARGWALVASARQARLAERLVAAAPGRFGALVVVGAADPEGPMGVSLAVVRTPPRRSTKPAPPAGVTVLTSPPSSAWKTAENWAAAETSLPLAAPLQLPAATYRPSPPPGPEPSRPTEGRPTEGRPSEGRPSEGPPSEGPPSEGRPSESPS